MEMINQNEMDQFVEEAGRTEAWRSSFGLQMPCGSDDTVCAIY
jgi:hypothetical protein